MNDTMLTLGRLATAVAATLAAGTTAAAPVYISTTMSTNATFDDRFHARPIIMDPLGPANAGALESYVESVNRFSGIREAMASATADDKGNAEVGAEVGKGGGTGYSTARSTTKIGYTNNTTNQQHVTFKFVILPGEVLIRDIHGDGLPVVSGAFSGGVNYAVDYINRNNEMLNVYDCQFSVISVARTWNAGEATNACGFDLVDEYFDGNGQYGATLLGDTVETPFFLQPGETIFAQLHMFAWANKLIVDWSGLMSAKLGDPLDPTVQGSFSIDVVDVPTPPSQVPEPASAWLAGLALLSLGIARAKRSGGARVA